MSSIFQWPFKRKEYPGLGNPRFVSDIVAANESVLDGLKALTGLSNTAFAIISGLDFISGPPNSYTPGVFYLNGTFYYQSAAFAEGLYLAPNPGDTMPQPFDDGNSRNIYTLFTGQSTSSPTGASPVFSGDMNTYRISLNNLKTQILNIASTIATLGTAAFRNVGTTTGTVAAGDDPRFGYTQSQIDTLFAKKVDVIMKGAGTVYTPTGAYDPATKLYADSAAGSKLLWVGNITSIAGVTKLGGSLTVTATRLGTGHYAIGHNNGANNFFVVGMGIDASNPQCSPRSYILGDTTYFDVFVSDDSSANDADFQLSMHQYF